MRFCCCCSFNLHGESPFDWRILEEKDSEKYTTNQTLNALQHETLLNINVRRFRLKCFSRLSSFFFGNFKIVHSFISAKFWFSCIYSECVVSFIDGLCTRVVIAPSAKLKNYHNFELSWFIVHYTCNERGMAYEFRCC